MNEMQSELTQLRDAVINEIPAASIFEADELALLLYCTKTPGAGLLQGKNLTDARNQLLQLNRKQAREQFKQDRSTIALYLHEHAPFYNQQQIFMLEALRADPRYNVVTIISVGAYPVERFSVDSRWFDGPVLYLPDDKELQSFDWIDAIITLDYCASRPIPFPKRAKRILQPHGTDIKFQYSMEFYGAGLIFDYLLVPSFAPEILPDDFRERYYNVFPKCLVDHTSNELRLIAFGSPKLDEFMRCAKDRTKSDIVYNISYWGLESSFVHENLTKTIRRILSEFPDRRIVFRSFPGQGDLVEDQIREFRGHPRFFVSVVDSYIEDYAGGAVLIYHRGSSAEVFALATGSPIIRFDGHESPGLGVTETELGYVARSEDQLIDTMHSVLAQPDRRRSQITAFRDSILPNAGRTIPYLLDCLEHIVRDQPLSDWKRILLHDISSSDELDRAKVMQSSDICRAKNFSIPMLASKCADLIPGEPELQFRAAKAIFEHIYASERVRDPWLIALRYLERYLELRRAGSPSDLYGGEASDWLRTVFPERFMGTMSFALANFTPEELAELRKVVKKLPLDTLDPLGIPEMLRQKKQPQAAALSNALLELAATKARLGLELLYQGKFVDAEKELREAQRGNSRDIGILFLLAHAIENQRRHSEAIEILEVILRVDPSHEEVQNLLAQARANEAAANGQRA